MESANITSFLKEPINAETLLERETLKIEAKDKAWMVSTLNVFVIDFSIPLEKITIPPTGIYIEFHFHDVIRYKIPTDTMETAGTIRDLALKTIQS